MKFVMLTEEEKVANQRRAARADAVFGIAVILAIAMIGYVIAWAGRVDRAPHAVARVGNGNAVGIALRPTGQRQRALDPRAEREASPMKGIQFVQYLRPFGEQRPQWIRRPAEIEEKAKAVVAAGGRFEMEQLRTGEASFEVVREIDGETESVATEVCANGPDVLATVDKLVGDAYQRLCPDISARASS